MIQRGGERGLSEQAIERIILSAVAEDEHAAEDFERDVAAKPPVARAIDLAHAAGAELRQYFVGADLGSRGEGHVKGSANYNFCGRSIVAMSG